MTDETLKLYPWVQVRSVARTTPEVFQRLVGSGLLLDRKLYKIEGVRGKGSGSFLLLKGGRVLGAYSVQETAKILPCSAFEEYFTPLLQAAEEEPIARDRRLASPLRSRPGVTPSKPEHRAVKSTVARPMKELRALATLYEPVIRDDWEVFEQVLVENHVGCLWHFTDVANLESIRRCGGLLSWYQCDRRGVRIERPGGSPLSRNLDARADLRDYIRLSFNANPPMLAQAQKEGRVGEVALIRVDRSVVFWKDTKFSHLNATDNDAMVGGDVAALSRIDFPLAMSRKWDEKDQLRRRQAEVLVPTHIPLRFLSHGSLSTN